MTTANQPPGGLRTARLLALSVVVAAFPVATLAAHGFGVDRGRVAAALAATFTAGIYVALSAPWWPWPRTTTREPILDALTRRVANWAS